MSAPSTVDVAWRLYSAPSLAAAPWMPASSPWLAVWLRVRSYLNLFGASSRREHHRELGGTPCTFDALESFEGSGGGQVLAPLVLVNVGATGVDAAEPHGVGDSVSGTKGDDLAGHGGSQDVAALGLEQAGPG